MKLGIGLQKAMANNNRLDFNPLECKGNYNASNNMKLVHWPLTGGLLHLVQRGGAGFCSLVLTLYRHIKTAEQRTIIRQYSD